MRSLPMIPSNWASAVMAVHVIEHFYRWEVPPLLAEWHRVLAPGGAIILELPDIVKCARNILEMPDNEQQGMWGAYGDPGHRDPLMCHRWGWHPGSLTKVLEEAGFSDIREETPQWHKAGRARRDMRLVGRKK